MAYTLFTVEDFVYDTDELAHIGNSIELRRVNPATNKFDPTVPLPAAGKVFSTATYTCPCMDIEVGWRLVLPLAVRTYDEDTGLVSQGSLSFQLYNGTSWYWYDTTAPAGWKIVTSPSTEWTTETNLCLYFATYPGRLKREIAVRCLVQPDSTGEYAPKPQALLFIWTTSFAFDSTKDALQGLIDFCNATKVPFQLRNQLAAASATYVIDHDTTPIPVGSGGNWKVYNLSTDPTRQTNLFSSWTAGTATVTMTASQPLGSVIETFFEAYIPSYLSADSTFYNATTPSIVVRFDKQSDIDRQWSQQGHRISLPDAGGLTWTNEHVPETIKLSLRFFCQASRHEEALDIGNALLKRLQINNVISPGTMRPIIKILPMQALSQAIEIKKDLYVYTIPFTLIVKQWELTTNTITEYTLRELYLQMANSTVLWDLLSL